MFYGHNNSISYAQVFQSEMHRDVSACLTHLGIEHENGVLCGQKFIEKCELCMGLAEACARAKGHVE